MRANRVRVWGWCLSAGLAVAVGGTGASAAQKEEPKKPAPAAAAADHAAAGQATGREHEVLKKLAGEWDAAITIFTPDGQQFESKGKESSKLVLGGKFLESTFEGEIMNMPFAGRGMLGYDTALKKYVNTWADSMNTGIMYFEGTADEAKKTITYTTEKKNPEGKAEKWRSVHTMVDDRTHTFDMYVTQPGEKETKMMTIKYTKAK